MCSNSCLDRLLNVMRFMLPSPFLKLDSDPPALSTRDKRRHVRTNMISPARNQQIGREALTTARAKLVRLPGRTLSRGPVRPFDVDVCLPVIGVVAHVGALDLISWHDASSIHAQVTDGHHQAAPYAASARLTGETLARAFGLDAVENPHFSAVAHECHITPQLRVASVRVKVDVVFEVLRDAFEPARVV